jgi:hypothetical protein
MATIRQMLNELIQQPTYFVRDSIAILDNDGNHTMASGRVAPVLTDEKLYQYDQVITVMDADGNYWTLGGVK